MPAKKAKYKNEATARRLLKKGYKIAAILEIRNANQLGLKESKDIVDGWLPQAPAAPPVVPATTAAAPEPLVAATLLTVIRQLLEPAEWQADALRQNGLSAEGNTESPRMAAARVAISAIESGRVTIQVRDTACQCGGTCGRHSSASPRRTQPKRRR